MLHSEDINIFIHALHLTFHLDQPDNLGGWSPNSPPVALCVASLLPSQNHVIREIWRLNTRSVLVMRAIDKGRLFVT